MLENSFNTPPPPPPPGLAVRLLSELAGGYGTSFAFANGYWASAATNKVQLWQGLNLAATVFAPGTDSGGLVFATAPNKVLAGSARLDFSTGTVEQLPHWRDGLIEGLEQATMANLSTMNVARSADGSIALVFALHRPPRGIGITDDYSGPAQRLVVLDGQTGQHQATLWEGSELFDRRALAVSQSYLASAAEAVKVWHRANYAPAATLKAGSGVRVITFSADEAWLAVARANGQLEVWNTHDWTINARWQDEERNILSLAWLPDANILATGDTRGLLRFWQIDKDQAPQVVGEFKLTGSQPVEGIGVDPAGQWLVAANRFQQERLVIFEVSTNIPS